MPRTSTTWIVEAVYEDGERFRHVYDDYPEMLAMVRKYQEDGLRPCRSKCDAGRVPVGAGAVHFWEM